MDIKNLKALLQIADRGSFGDAATAMGISISSVSLHISSLEQHLGVLLFDRKSRPPVLTEAGAEFVAKARTLLADWEELSENFGPAQRQQHLRIGAVHTSVVQLLPVALKKLSRSKPELQVSLKTGLSHELEREIINRKLDCAVVTLSEQTSPELTETLLFEEAMAVIAHKNAAGSSWRELLELNPYIQFSRPAAVARMIESELRSQNVSVHSTMEIDTLEGVVALVKNRLGVSIIPGSRHINRLPSSIQSQPFSTPVLARRLGILSRTDSRKKALIDDLVSVMT